VFAAIIAVLLGAALTYLKITHRLPWLFKPLYWFVKTVHDIPALALMMFFYYVIFAGVLNGMLVTIIALGIYTSGSLVKIFTISIQQINKGQIEAGLTLGMTKRQCYQHIVLPQALKAMLPILAGELKLLLRSTSYAGYIAQNDLMEAVHTIEKTHHDTFLPLIIVSILYLILSWIITSVIDLLYVKLFGHD
jgi:ABC-type amino acid transport system permease subunit